MHNAQTDHLFSSLSFIGATIDIISQVWLVGLIDNFKLSWTHAPSHTYTVSCVIIASTRGLFVCPVAWSKRYTMWSGLHKKLHDFWGIVFFSHRLAFGLILASSGWHGNYHNISWQKELTSNAKLSIWKDGRKSSLRMPNCQSERTGTGEDVIFSCKG